MVSLAWIGSGGNLPSTLKRIRGEISLSGKTIEDFNTVKRYQMNVISPGGIDGSGDFHELWQDTKACIPFP
jgi:hypothetical protein